MNRIYVPSDSIDKLFEYFENKNIKLTTDTGESTDFHKAREAHFNRGNLDLALLYPTLGRPQDYLVLGEKGDYECVLKDISALVQ